MFTVKILLLSSLFPHYDNPNVTYATPFLFNYAREWVRQGHEVTVMHMMRSYPKGFNGAATLLAKLGNHRLEKYIIDPAALKPADYVHEGVRIHRFIFRKYIPHGPSSEHQVRTLAKKVAAALDGDQFVPDLVIGDFFDPVLRVVDMLRSRFSCPIAQTMHVSDYTMFEQKQLRSIVDKVDLWLLRTASQEQYLKKYLTGEYRCMPMYSGVPEAYVAQQPVERTAIQQLLFVGMLNKFKGIDTILDALAKTRELGLKLNIVGKGTDEEYFRQRVEELKLTDIVHFVGKVSHDEVFRYMRQSDLQVMISHETFGMVYVEAMSQGCIPVGAVGEGIDGVVVNGVNGYLSPLNDSDALAALFTRLVNAPAEEISQVSARAYQTAQKMTHAQLAEEVLAGIQEAAR